MKRTVIILLLVLGFAVQSWGQEKEKEKNGHDKVVAINSFGKNTYFEKGTKKLRIGETVKFKIVNVNTFKVRGFTESVVYNFASGIPPIFIDNKNTDSPPEPGTPSIETEDKNKKDEKKEPDAMSPPESPKDCFREKPKEFMSLADSIEHQANFKSYLQNKLKDPVFIPDIAQFKESIEREYNKTFPQGEKEDISKKLNRLDKIYNELVECYDKRIIKSSDSSQVGKTAKASGQTEVLDDSKKVSEIMNSIKKVYEKISSQSRKEIITSIQEGVNLYGEVSAAQFEIYTDAVQINDDEVTITPVLKNNDNSVAHTFQPIKFRARGGVKVNFSTGYLLNFASDDNYSTFKDSEGNISGVVQSNKSAITHALGGFVHATHRSASDVTWGFSAGLSLATSGSLGFYFGPSLFLLEKHRLVLTGGYSFNSFHRLNKSNLQAVNKEDNQYIFINKSDTEVKYDNVYKGAVFVGVTYNLSK